MPIISSVPDVGSRVSLTFDDGPLIPYTADILDVLKEHGTQATLFIRGGAINDLTPTRDR
jgi:peptidoglycan/xylan/chitin deacetylase (PgdA/CDA1 family)